MSARRARDGRRLWPWLSACVLLGGGTASAEPAVTGAVQAGAGADGALVLSARLEGRGRHAALVLTWTNQGRAPLLLLTHADTDAGVMFDAIEIQQGSRHALMKSPRKAVAPRFCALPGGHSHAVRVEGIQAWLPRLGFDAARPWQVAYAVAAHVQAPRAQAAMACGKALPAIVYSGTAAPLWRGRLPGPTLCLEGGPVRGLTAPR